MAVILIVVVNYLSGIRMVQAWLKHALALD